MDHNVVYNGPNPKIGNVSLQHYNKDAASERRIEIALGLDFISRFSPETIIEVGAVLPTHEPINHDVVDMYDVYSKSIRKDATTYDYTGKNVLSISTIEHIGRNDYPHLGDVQTISPDSAFKCLEKIIKESNKYMITFPVDWNKDLEERIKNTEYPRIIMARNEKNEWVYRCSRDNFNFAYGKPFDYANAIIIITNIEDYLFDYDRIESVLSKS